MNMDPVKDAAPCYDQMAIVEKYEKVIAYLYPIAQSIPRKHGVARDMFLQRLLSIPDMMFQAGKSTQVSKLYFADAALADQRRQVSGAGQDEEVGMIVLQNMGGIAPMITPVSFPDRLIYPLFFFVSECTSRY